MFCQNRVSVLLHEALASIGHMTSIVTDTEGGGACRGAGIMKRFLVVNIFKFLQEKLVVTSGELKGLKIATG